MELLGFEIKRRKQNQAALKRGAASVVTPTQDDGSTVVSTASAYYGVVLDVEGIVKNEGDLIRRYREIAQYGDVDMAIDDIVNESIITENNEPAVKINLDKTPLSDNIKKKIREEFSEILTLYRFNDKGHDIFRQWYIDGRLYYNVIIDEENPRKGIQELRFVDPRKIRRIKQITKDRNEKGVEVVKDIQEYYLYNDKGITESTTQGVRLSLDSIIYAPSGLQDYNTGMVLSPLHKAIKPTNQLKMLEDAVVIYRLSRAPERRIFYVDVGNLPKLKAEQYVNDIMNKFRNKIVYDATTGETKDDRRHLSMMEDFWMPRREGGKGTEITTLQGGMNLGEIEDLQYFQKKLFQSLNVPVSRLEQSTGFSIGRSSEINRDEIKFNKFIQRMRNKFSILFYNTLRIQLVAKGIVKDEEWEELIKVIRFDFTEDNHFAELKHAELIQNRIEILNSVAPYIGKFYSQQWVRKNILMQTDQDIEEIDAQIKKEGPFYMNPEDEQLAQQNPNTGEPNE